MLSMHPNLIHGMRGVFKVSETERVVAGESGALLEGDCGALQLPEIACGNGRVSRVLCQCSYARFINVSKGVLVGAQHNV